jgi:acyl carrier protein
LESSSKCKQELSGEKRMNEQDVINRSQKILADLTGLDEGEIHLESTLMEDLGIESFDLSDLNFMIKEEFSIEREFDFLSIEGIAGNPDFLSEDNYLTLAGIREMKRRIPGLDISEDVIQEGLSLMGGLSKVNVKNMVDYILRR